MSSHTARHVLDSMNLRASLIARRYVDASLVLPGLPSGGFLSDLRELAAADPIEQTGLAERRKAELCGAYGGDYQPDNRKPFVFLDGKAIIPVHGILINRFAYSWGFATGYNFIRAQIEAALADGDVDGIIYDVNTYGGTVAGCKETADIVYSSSLKGGGKKSLAVIDSNCYSAGYYCMSGTDSISCTPSGGAGSIGVVVMHMDVSGALDQAGVKVTFITAPEGGHKADFNPYEALTEEVRADVQAEVDKMYEAFVGTVVRNRPSLAEATVRETKARCYLADDALALGLIDSVQTPPEALNDFFNDDEEEDETDDEHEEEPEMAVAPVKSEITAEQQAAAVETASAAAADKARKEERARVAAITGHAEAAGRESLAQHLAMETDTTPEAAAKILAASAKAAPQAAATAPVVAEGNAFKNAMGNTKNPNVGADDGTGGGEGDEQKESTSARILRNQAKAAGKKAPATA